MAVHYLDPNGDGKADWDETPGGTAASCLDDGIRAPSAPNLTDYVSTSTIDEDCRVTMSTVVLGGGETVIGIRAYAYVETPADRQLRWSVSFPLATGLAFTETVDENTTGWVSATVQAPFTQTQLDNMEITFDVPDAGSGTVRVYACYIEVHTRTDEWSAAQAKLYANRNANTGLSIGAGFLGGDCFYPVQLSATVTAYLMRDTHVATAAGQQQTFGTNPNQGVSSGRTSFVRSAIYIQNGANPETATFTLFTGAGNTDYFPDHADGRVRWPQGGFIKDGRLFVVGMLETGNIQPTGRWVAYCDDWDSNPTNPSLWTWTFPDTANYRGGLSEVGVGAQGIFDNSATDGFVYLFDDGTLFTTTKAISIYRLPEAQFDAGDDWRGGEWWTGSGWSKDKPGIITAVPPGIIGKKKPRGGTYDFTLGADEGVNEGTIHRLGDGRWVRTGIFDAPWTWDPVVQHGTRPYHMAVSFTDDTTIGSKFQTPVEKYTLSDVEEWVYFGSAMPWLTWTGQGANDIAGTYNGNQDTDSGNNFGTGYYPKFCKLLSVT